MHNHVPIQGSSDGPKVKEQQPASSQRLGAQILAADNILQKNRIKPPD